MNLKEGQKAPSFTAKTDGDIEISLSDFKGKNVVLYFYPKDNTPGCTKQACGFNDDLQSFEDNNTVILGVSKDSVKKHDGFKNKYGLGFPLISDEDGALCDAYHVWKEKSMYGKTFMGIERTTFLIDGEGTIQKIWSKVKVKDHIPAVLDAVKAL